MPLSRAASGVTDVSTPLLRDMQSQGYLAARLTNFLKMLSAR